MGRGETALERYCRSVASGREVACAKMRKLCARLLADVGRDDGPWAFDPEAAERPVRFIESFCKVPSGRLGKPLELEDYEKAIVEAVFGFVDRRTGLRRYNDVFVCVARKNGKALALDTEIPTPDGWRTMGDIHVGDLVFGRDGRPAEVVAESPVFHKRTYLVEFEDGEAVKASADHLWTVQTRSSRHSGKGWFVIDTESMARDYAHARRDGKGVERKYRVPMPEPVEYPERELPIDPYVLGSWLGDGTATKPELTVGDEDLDETVAIYAAHGVELTRVRCPSDGGKAARMHIGPSLARGVRSDALFQTKLRRAGLLGNKHVPGEYMVASASQRMELLRGLMDTDGTCSKAGQCSFTQKRRAIAESVVELCSSLGIKATMRERDVSCAGVPAGTVYEVQFWTDKSRPCFHLSRKRDRLKDRLAPRMGAKSISMVTEVPTVPSKCIAVDNPDHLYLFGRRYTATHNTSLAAAVELYMLMADGEGAPQVYNSANNLDQATLGYNAAVKMVRQSRDISRHVHKQADRLYCDLNMGFVKPMASNALTLDGLDVHMAVIDEIHAMRSREVYDLMKQATAARDQPLILQVTTNGFVRGSIFDTTYDYAARWLDGKVDDERFLPFVFELDDRDEWEDESCWKKANPGLGTVKSPDYLRANVAKARDDPSFLPTVLTKDFNVPANSSSAWLTFEEAVNAETFDVRGMGFSYGIVGFDASDTVDLTAARMMLMRPGDDRIYEIGMYWLPEDVLRADQDSGRGRERDGAPYRLWESRGLLRTVPGNKVPKSVLFDWINEVSDELDICTYAVGFDPWHMDDASRASLEALVGRGRAVVVRQGTQTLSQPMKQLRADLRANRIVDNHNPVNEWCRMNVSARCDVNGNIQPDKKLNDPRNRIDGFMAELDAYVTLLNMMDEYRQVC